MPRTDSEFHEEYTADDNDFDIIIVGAGLSGLMCAYNILKRQAGLDVLIIEANRDVGGRILRDFSNGYYANSLQEHVTKLVKILKINIHKIQDIGVKEKILFTKCRPYKKLPRFFGADVHHFLHLVEKKALDEKFTNYTNHEDSKLLAKTSVEDFLRRNIYIPYSRTLCRTFVCSSCATRNLNEVSSLWFFVMLNGSSGFFNRLKFTIGDENRFFVQDGMFRIVKEILKKIECEGGQIRYLEPVKKIRFNNDRAYVQTEKKSFKCAFVIVAVPPPIEDIVFESPLEYSLDAQNLYVPGENVLFKITYNSSPWQNDNAKDILTTWDTNSELNTAYNMTYNNTRAFVISGLLAQTNSTQPHNKGLFDTLNKCFGTNENAEHLQYKLWNPVLSHEQTVISSPMSVMKPAPLMKHVHFAGVSNGRVFLASSENAAYWPGTVNGCIEIGEITAYAILSRIRPQALTPQEIHINTQRSRMKRQQTSFNMCVMQYLGIVFNVAIFLSFLRASYKHK